MVQCSFPLYPGDADSTRNREFPKIRGRDAEPKWQGSYYKDT